MLQVVTALIPATAFGIWRFGLHAALVLAASIVSALLTEFIFDYVTGKPNTLTDCSALVTGLLLGLSLSPAVPLYIPVLGGVFAILFAKCLFGGLGRNFMNPALAARCFLLISFVGPMTTFMVDGISSSTPLAVMQAGGTIHVADIYLGFSNSIIGGSSLALLVGGLYLWLVGGITIEIPASCIIAFTGFIALFGGQGFDVPYLLANICAGGILMGGIFMATDPVTSPMTSKGQIIFGAIVGILAGLFRVKGSSADSVSYAIIFSNLLVPFIDKIPVNKPLGYNNGENKKEFPKSAVNLTLITLVAGLALSAAYMLTKDTIELQQNAANIASYQAVCPDAENFENHEDLDAAVEALGGGAIDEAFGKTAVNKVVVGTGADGSVAGYVINASSFEGYDGEIAVSVGLSADGTVTGIAFTVMNETPGKGTKCDEDEFKSQFAGVQTDAFALGGDIDGVAGATVSSKAVVNAVNTALAFYAANIG